MASLKDVLVVTTTTIDGFKVRRYLKPVSAHIVAGTNLFSDFFGGLTDVFGGRSQSYQKQLTSLYNEAIERVKHAAYEAGGNCVLGLNIDMDEISGGGKSMFMITAVGTATIMEKETEEKNILNPQVEESENVSIDRVNTLRQRKSLIEKAKASSLTFTDELWDFLISNRVYELFPFIIKLYSDVLSRNQLPQDAFIKFKRQVITYFDALPGNMKYDLLYDTLKDSQKEDVVLLIFETIKELNLFDYNRSMELLKSDSFSTKKRGVRVATYDKPFYSKQDLLELETMRDVIQTTFSERGTRIMKKQLLSSKEKEVWTCEYCKKTNDMGAYCTGCDNDIYGFHRDEINPVAADEYIKQKAELISEYIK